MPHQGVWLGAAGGGSTPGGPCPGISAWPAVDGGLDGLKERVLTLEHLRVRGAALEELELAHELGDG